MRVEQAELLRYYCFAKNKMPKKERLSHCMFIISYTDDLEKLKDYELQIKPPPEMKDFFQ
jgi:hypothetical protein